MSNFKIVPVRLTKALTCCAMIMIGCTPSVPDMVKQRLKSADVATRYRATEQLSLYRNRVSISLLITALRDPDSGVRMVAAENLGILQAKEAAGALVGTLSDSNMWVRAKVADALSEIGGREAAPALAEMLAGAMATRPSGIYVTHQWGDDAAAAAAALKHLTGQDFGFDSAKWKAWLAESNFAAPG